MRAYFAFALASVVALASLPTGALGAGSETNSTLVIVMESDETLRSPARPSTNGDEDTCPPSCLSPSCAAQCGVSPGPTVSGASAAPPQTNEMASEPPLPPPDPGAARHFRPPRLS